MISDPPVRESGAQIMSPRVGLRRTIHVEVATTGEGAGHF